jgi:cyclophilin family peptidyl-prolyl cis-trans isomerase
VKFHRIMKGFMVQTGDPLGTGTGGPGYRFKDEPVKRDYLRGTLAMANAGPNTNGSQFFIMHANYPLPKNYTIFGKLTSGLEILDAIATTEVKRSSSGEPSVPIEDIRITNITIQEA